MDREVGRPAVINRRSIDTQRSHLTLFYEQRRETAARATDRNLHDAADMHRKIYQAIRARDVEGARRAMNEHLIRASAYLEQERNDSARSAAAVMSPATNRGSQP